MDKTLIPLLYASQDYEGERIECPWCHKPDFTIKRTPRGYLYNCYHDSCRARNPSYGFYPATTHDWDQQAPKPRDTTREFRHSTRRLTASESAWLRRTFRLKYETIRAAGIRYAPAMERYIWPIRGLYGEPRGLLARSYNSKHKTKAIAYKQTADPFVHYAYAPEREWDTLVVVEDFLSALRVQQLGYTSLALLGTHMPWEVVDELIRVRPKHLLIALDKDATAKAYKLREDIGVYFPAVTVAALTKDLKDDTDTGIIQVLSLGISANG